MVLFQMQLKPLAQLVKSQPQQLHVWSKYCKKVSRKKVSRESKPQVQNREFDGLITNLTKANNSIREWLIGDLLQ